MRFKASFGILLVLAALLHCAVARAAEPQPAPLCTEEVRVDAGKVAKCSALGVPVDKWLGLVRRVADADTATATCKSEGQTAAESAASRIRQLEEDNARTEQARAAAEAARVPKLLPLPDPFYKSGVFWTGVALVGGAVAGGVATGDTTEVWIGVGGVGLGFIIAELVP